MSLELLVGIVAIAGTLVTMADRFFIKPYKHLEERLVKLEEKITQMQVTDAKQELKIETCWTAWMDNAKLAVAQNPKNLGKMNTPLKITDKARKLFNNINLTQPLQEFYRQEGINLSCMEMEMEIARRFRPILIEKLCIPLGFHLGECVAMAVEIAKEGDTAEQDIAAGTIKATDTVKKDNP